MIGGVYPGPSWRCLLKQNFKRDQDDDTGYWSRAMLGNQSWFSSSCPNSFKQHGCCLESHDGPRLGTMDISYQEGIQIWCMKMHFLLHPNWFWEKKNTQTTSLKWFFIGWVFKRFFKKCKRTFLLLILLPSFLSLFKMDF